MENMEKDDARTLLQSTQELRTHWSGVITSHFGYAIALNVAIWSYLLKSYIDSLAASSQSQPSYIVLAAGLSAILLGVWRVYTHEIDDYIAALYPDFLLYESILSVPYDHGTSRYLIKAVPNVRLILLDNELTPEQKLKGITALAELRRVGTRGHFRIDFFTLVIIFAMFEVGLLSLSKLPPLPWLAFAYFFLIYIGVFLTLFAMLYYQKKPSEKLIQRMLIELKRNG